MADPFQPKFVDLVRNTTTTFGAGNFVLGAAVTGYTSFLATCAVGDSFYYSAIGIDKPAEREVGRGTLLPGGVISRDPIGGVKTSFSSGTKWVALIAAAAQFVAAYTSGGWRLLPPIEGMSFYVKATGTWANYRSGAWEIGMLRGSAVLIGGQQVVGGRGSAIASPSGGATVDSEARAVVGEILSALRLHGLIEA